MKTYYVLIEKNGQATYIACTDAIDYVAKAKALKISREFMKNKIPAVIVRRLDKLAIELLRDEAKRMKRGVAYDYEDENVKDDYDYLDSTNAEMAAERYCMSHA